jgi:hypothetical protein
VTLEDAEVQFAVALGRSLPAAVEQLAVGAPPAAPWAWAWDWATGAYRLHPRVDVPGAWLRWSDGAWAWSAEVGGPWTPVWSPADARHRPDCVLSAMICVFDLRAGGGRI